MNKNDDRSNAFMEKAPATVHLVEGPVGAGKSTYAARLGQSHAAPRFNLDEWMVTLFSPDRPEKEFMAWYAERKSRCIAQIWNQANDLIVSEQSVVLELGLIRRQDREDFYGRVDVVGCPLIVYILQVEKEERRRRVQERNSQGDGTFKMYVSDEVFNLADSMWQPPDDRELGEREIRYVC